MPRDLSDLVPSNNLTNSPDVQEASQSGNAGEASHNERQAPPAREPPMSAEDEGKMFAELAKLHGTSKRDELHPYTQVLTLSDVDSCTVLEEAAFPPQERATREKFMYRITACPELTLGIYTSHVGSGIPTAVTATPVYTRAPERKAVLLGHIVSTKTTNLVVADDDMAIPSPNSPTSSLGHQEFGRTVCIHSLAVLPDYQHRGLGKTLMKAYLGRLQNQDVCDRVALISHEHLVPFYEDLGFERVEESKATFGGGGWVDMVQDFEQ